MAFALIPGGPENQDESSQVMWTAAIVRRIDTAFRIAGELETHIVLRNGPSPALTTSTVLGLSAVEPLSFVAGAASQARELGARITAACLDTPMCG